jgi:hypothetical protein
MAKFLVENVCEQKMFFVVYSTLILSMIVSTGKCSNTLFNYVIAFQIERERDRI